MPATVMIDGKEAMIKDYVWVSGDKELINMLNEILPLGGPSGADPNPDGTAAQEAVKVLGGKVLKIVPVEFDPEVIY